MMRAAVRRLSQLAVAFGAGPHTSVEYPPNLEDVEVVQGELQTWRGSRFSRRQGHRHPLDGWSGAIRIRGPVADMLGPLVQLAGPAQLGKHTTMGFGVVRAWPVG